MLARLAAVAGLLLCLVPWSGSAAAGEVLERQERHEDAIIWAQAELADPFVISNASKLRAGQLLGRAHAARDALEGG